MCDLESGRPRNVGMFTELREIGCLFISEALGQTRTTEESKTEQSKIRGSGSGPDHLAFCHSGPRVKP